MHPGIILGLGDKRFEKNDLLRIVRALAIFRPSLIALQMPLSVEDEVFVEKCFQRSLVVSPSLCPLYSSFSCETLWLAGTRQADLIQRDTHSCVEADGRNMSRRSRVLHSDRMVYGRSSRAEDIYLRGTSRLRPPIYIPKLLFPLAFRELVGCGVLGNVRLPRF